MPAGRGGGDQGSGVHRAGQGDDMVQAGQGQPDQVAENQQEKSQDEKAQAQIGEPGQQVAPPVLRDEVPQEHQAGGQEHEQDQGQPGDQVPGEGELGRGDQAPSGVPVDGAQDAQGDQEKHAPASSVVSVG